MNIKLIKVSIILLCLIGCSPTDKKSESELSEFSEIETIDESTLENARQAAIALSDEAFQTSVEEKAREHEENLLEDVKSQQQQAEARLLKAQAITQGLAEQALIDSAKNPADEIDTSNNL